MKITERLERPIAELGQTRDELRVQAKLGRAELRDQWEDLEEKWSQLQGKLKVVREASKQSAKQVGGAWCGLLNELTEGYRRIRTAFRIETGPTTQELEEQQRGG